MKGALDGVRVVEFTSFTAGPLCGAVLAQLGAEVIKIEPPGGDHLRRLAVQFGGTSYLYHINNAGKRSVVADLKHPDGRQLAFDLASDADVVLENFAPSTLERYGLGYEAVRQKNPRIIYCSVNGFGSYGPLKQERAYDVVTQGLAGVISLTGYDPQRPVKVGPSVVDMMGAFVGAASIIAALLHRRKAGEGQVVEVAMYDVATWLTAEAWPSLMSGGTPAPIGARSRSRGWQDVFATLDGHVALAAVTDAQRATLSGFLALTSTAPDDTALVAAARSWCACRTTADAVDCGRRAGIVVAPALTVNEVARERQFTERGVIVDMSDSVGRRGFTFGSPFRMTQTPGLAHGFAEPVGASTERVLAELELRRSNARA